MMKPEKHAEHYEHDHLQFTVVNWLHLALRSDRMTGSCSTVYLLQTTRTWTTVFKLWI